MSTITQKQQQKIEDVLRDMYLPVGIGTEDEACSVAAINLALTGMLTDDIPECMSEVVGRWIISVQDAMPDKMRNSAEWKRLLPLAAGTGRYRESERSEIILDWMWGTVLPYLQPLADERGFGKEWKRMTTERTKKAAGAARVAAEAAWAAARDAAAAEAAWAAEAAEAAWAAAEAARVAAEAAEAAWDAAEAAEAAAAWDHFDPIRLLDKLIAVGV